LGLLSRFCAFLLWLWRFGGFTCQLRNLGYQNPQNSSFLR
jgi:hypothetical protein